MHEDGILTLPLQAIKGRGAASRMVHRFARDARDAFDDGWDAQAVFGELPQTATDAPMHTLMGAAALLLAGVAQLARRIRRGRYTA